MKLTEDQIAHLLSAFWIQANLPDNLPSNIEAIAHSFILTLISSRLKVIYYIRFILLYHFVFVLYFFLLFLILRSHFIPFPIDESETPIFVLAVNNVKFFILYVCLYYLMCSSDL